MRAIIAGCGRVGSALASQLVTEGHGVSVIDQRREARQNLPANFPGLFLVGSGASLPVLDASGIEHADAFVASADDQTNLAMARIAKQTYRVPVVVACVVDPDFTDLYQGLGVHTVVGVRWTVFQMHQLLLHRHLAPELTFGNGETLLIRSQLPSYLAGRRLTVFDVDTEIRVVEVTRAGTSHIPARDTVIQVGDLVTFAVAATALHRLQGFLDRPLGV